MRPVGGGAPASLARFGFADPRLAAELLGPTGLGWWHPHTGAAGDAAAAVVVATLARADDPDLAVRSLHRLVGAQDDPGVLRTAIGQDAGLRQRLIGVLGASAAFGDHLVSNPREWRLLTEASWCGERPSSEVLRGALLEAVGAPVDEQPTWGSGGVKAAVVGPAAVAALRRAYRRSLLIVAARDVTARDGDGADVADITAELSDLAAATLGAALAVAAAELPENAPAARLAIIGMGKCGGHELNYVSDVDVIFVAEPGGPDPEGEPVELSAGLRTATTLASAVMRICQAVAWPVDAALRPEGKDGPLVRTLASHEAYYKQWARTWEFQALLKARPVAGDAPLAEDWMAAVTPLVWHAADRPGVVNDVRAMRRRVEESLPARDAKREIKLGPGGLRDIEFAVQLLQLVHGRNDESLRCVSTLDAVRALTDGGYVGRVDGDGLDSSYRFLRRVEHRLQLQRLRRTHRVPHDDRGLRWLAQALGYRGDARAGAVERFTAEWSRHAREVRRLHEKLFYRPLLEAAATVSGDTLRLSPDSARARLEVLGFADPAGALRHIEALTTGVSRRAALQRALLPTILATFADAPDPDAGLLAYRKVSDRLGQTPWYLRLLRDEGLVAVRFARLLGTSRYVGDLLGRDPEGLRLLADSAELAPRPPEALHGVLGASVQRHAESPDAGVVAARALRRRELLRIASADLLGFADTVRVGCALSDVTDAVLDAALGTAIRAVTKARGTLPARIAMIGMGRLGGAELSYSSDADVMFVHEPVDGASDAEAAAAAAAVAEELRRMLAAPAPDPPVGLDTTLRPEGRQGPPTRSLASYAEYYRRWSHIWEAQALLRARPVAGDADLGSRFMALIDPLRYPEQGLTAAQVVEIRRIKARVDAERLPRGADPATHVKLGRGGLADVEWTVQLLQLQNAAEIKPLRTPRTLEALTAARDAGLVSAADHDALAAAWLLATRVRNAIMLVRARPSDQLPRRGPELVGVARVLGSPPGGDPGEFVDEYLRTMRRGRQAVERVFYA